MNKVILIYTDSYCLLEEELPKLIKDDNRITYNLSESTIDDVIDEAGYFSLFSDKKTIIGMNANFFGKAKLKDDESKRLINYINNPNDNTTLIFITYEEIDKRKSITKKIIENNSLIELKAPKGYDLYNSIKKKLSIYKVAEETIKYLISACLNQYDVICQEIDKLALKYQKNDVITLENIKEIVPMSYNDNVFSFVDRVVNKDMKKALSQLEELTYLKIDSIQLLGLIIREYRLMYYYKTLEKNNAYNITKELQLQEWQLKKVIQNCSLYHIDDIKDILIELSNIDYQTKSGLVDKKIALQNFIINKCS